MYSAFLIRRCCPRALRLHLSAHAARRRTPSHQHACSVLAQTFSSAPPLGQPLDRDEGFFIDDERDLLAGPTGFFPGPDPQQQEDDDEGTQLIKDVDKLLDKEPRERFSRARTLQPPNRTLFRRKIDLSGVDPQDFQASAKAKQNLISQPFFRTSYQLLDSPFRTSGTYRWLTAAYIDNVIHSQRNGVSSDSPLGSDEVLSRIFSRHNVEYLEHRGYGAGDVLTWSWVLTAESTDLAIQRYNAVYCQPRPGSEAGIPQWLVLQLLRSDHINAAALTLLISNLLDVTGSYPLLLGHPDTDLMPFGQGVMQDKARGLWDYYSATLLIVRLLRHARRVCPIAFEDIAKLACRLLVPLHQHGPSGFERLSYACNRLLTLMSLPAGERPYYSVAYQQRAQLALLDSMRSRSPQIPLNREGYRALIKVQLVHEKLDAERAWSRAQGDAWPPWPKPKLGIDQDIEYPGKESRAMKVLRRMLEAGYAHHAWERIASVLAGWDTDKSPTVQTRHIIRAARAAPLTEVLSGDASVSLVQQLWAARITATRSVREAWSCFNSYCKTTAPGLRDFQPYHAMFSKLIATSHKIEQDKLVLPGEGKETFPDPQSPRDLVYVESQPPSVDVFYRQMLNDGIKPVGRLLTDLICHANTLEEGFKYLLDSQHSEAKKDVLINVGKYPADHVRRMVNSIPDHLFAAFIGMLVRCSGRPGAERFGGFAVPAEFKNWRTGANYAVRLLLESETGYLPAWHAILRAFYVQMKEARSINTRQFKRWNKQACKLIGYFPWRRIDSDFTTFQIVHKILHIRVNSVDSAILYPSDLSLANRTKIIKALFTRAVYKRQVSWITEVDTKPILSWPAPENVQVLITALGIAEDTQGLLDLIEWLRVHVVNVKVSAANRKRGTRLNQINTVLLRIFLENLWMDEQSSIVQHSFSRSEFEDIKRTMVEGLGWPSDEEVAELLVEWPEWRNIVREAILARRKREEREPEEPEG